MHLNNEQDVKPIFKYANESGQNVTIRSAGSSVLMKHFRHQERTHSQEYVARQLVENWGEVEKNARVDSLWPRPQQFQYSI